MNTAMHGSTQEQRNQTITYSSSGNFTSPDAACSAMNWSNAPSSLVSSAISDTECQTTHVFLTQRFFISSNLFNSCTFYKVERSNTYGDWYVCTWSDIKLPLGKYPFCPAGFFVDRWPNASGVIQDYCIGGPTLATITLHGASQAYPAKTNGPSAVDLTAKVIRNGQPAQGISISLSVEVAANSGGHDHHDAARPKGALNGQQIVTVVTDANGEAKVSFQSTEIAGTHVIAAVCNQCSNHPTHTINVKVPDLIEEALNKPSHRAIAAA
jgi:hypothetical protein